LLVRRIAGPPALGISTNRSSMDEKWPDRNPPPRRPRLDRPTILAVDDDKSVLEALHLILDERYRVIEARNGEAAISLALSQEPDLILLDLLMVGMDGFGVLEELRHRRAKAPIVIVSGLNTAWTAAAALRRGATDYVTKPFDEDLLIDTIDSALTLANRSTQGQVLEAAAAPRILLIGADLGIASALTVAFRRHTNLLSVRNTAQALRSLGTEQTDVVVVDAWTRPADVAQLLEQPTLKSFGERVLIVGAPGTGKTLLFRALAGLWPWGAGTVTRPKDEQMLYLPRGTPYLPRGTLKEVLAYPLEVDRFADSAFTHALARLNLERLVTLLDVTRRWDRELSQDEQLGLALARIALQTPPWLLIDDMLGSLDDEALERVIDIFSNELAHTSVIHIGRAAQARDPLFHRVLHLVKSPAAALAGGAASKGATASVSNASAVDQR